MLFLPSHPMMNTVIKIQNPARCCFIERAIKIQLQDRFMMLRPLKWCAAYGAAPTGTSA
jgi:hypothetical protein